MQHSSMVLFCDECGLANDPEASYCAGCQSPLVQANSTLHIPLSPTAPVTIAPPTVREVTPGPLFVPTDQGTQHTRPRRYQTCDFRPGSLLAGRYEIKEEIGKGGFSTVYRAVDQAAGYNDRSVAIKRIQLNQLSPRQIIDATETFNREIDMLSRFKAMKGIPVYHEHLTDAENWYLITQYIKGETLEEYIQKVPSGHLAEKEVIKLGIALASLMQGLHDAKPPVIFRDLKPSNVMLAPDRTFFLIDFGIARSFTPGKTKDTTPLGSPGYAPPEQYGRAQTDQRSDIYSLGATLQTLLTGYDPLELRSGQSSRNSQAPSRALRKLLDAMLSPDASKRPAGMARVKKRLEYILQRPLALFLSGLIYPLVISIFWLFLALFTPWTKYFDGSLSWLILIPALAASVTQNLFNRKMRLPNPLSLSFTRFYWFGLVAGFLPLLVWQIFFRRLF